MWVLWFQIVSGWGCEYGSGGYVLFYECLVVVFGVEFYLDLCVFVFDEDEDCVEELEGDGGDECDLEGIE